MTAQHLKSRFQLLVQIYALALSSPLLERTQELIRCDPMNATPVHYQIRFIDLKDLIRELLLKDILSSYRTPTDRTSDPLPEPRTVDADWTDLFSEKDVMRFGLRSRSQVPLMITCISTHK